MFWGSPTGCALDRGLVLVRDDDQWQVIRRSGGHYVYCLCRGSVGQVGAVALVTGLVAVAVKILFAQERPPAPRAFSVDMDSRVGSAAGIVVQMEGRNQEEDQVARARLVEADQGESRVGTADDYIRQTAESGGRSQGCCGWEADHNGAGYVLMLEWESIERIGSADG